MVRENISMYLNPSEKDMQATEFIVEAATNDSGYNAPLNFIYRSMMLLVRVLLVVEGVETVYHKEMLKEFKDLYVSTKKFSESSYIWLEELKDIEEKCNSKHSYLVSREEFDNFFQEAKEFRVLVLSWLEGNDYLDNINTLDL